MSEAIQERERQVAWRITQIAILAFITFFVISIIDKDSDDTTNELQDSTLVNNKIKVKIYELKQINVKKMINIKVNKKPFQKY